MRKSRWAKVGGQGEEEAKEKKKPRRRRSRDENEAIGSKKIEAAKARVGGGGESKSVTDVHRINEKEEKNVRQLHRECSGKSTFQCHFIELTA